MTEELKQEIRDFLKKELRVYVTTQTQLPETIRTKVELYLGDELLDSDYDFVSIK